MNQLLVIILVPILLTAPFFIPDFPFNFLKKFFIDRVVVESGAKQEQLGLKLVDVVLALDQLEHEVGLIHLIRYYMQLIFFNLLVFSPYNKLLPLLIYDYLFQTNILFKLILALQAFILHRKYHNISMRPNSHKIALRCALLAPRDSAPVILCCRLHKNHLASLDTFHGLVEALELADALKTEVQIGL